MATTNLPEPAPDAPYADWRAYVAQQTGLTGSRLTAATRDYMQEAREFGSGGGPQPGGGSGGGGTGGGGTGGGNGGGGNPGNGSSPGSSGGCAAKFGPAPPGKKWVGRVFADGTDSCQLVDIDSGGQGGETEREKAAREAARQSAFDTLKSWFSQYGIDDSASGQGSLSSMIWQWIQQDKSADWIKLELRKTEQYKARFPGMEAISKKGMAMSEAEYIATERAYLQVLSTAGLDKVYGNRADYGRFIAAEVSAQELAARVQIAKDYVNMYAPASVKQQLRELYGMDDTQMAAYVLDTSEGKKKSLAALETEYTRRQSQAQVGGAAIDTGLGIGTPLRDQIAEAGYNYNQAMTGLGRAKTEADPYRRLGNLYGVATSTDELIQENFGLGGGAEATTKKKKLASRERAAFSGSSALSAGSLAANRIGQV